MRILIDYPDDVIERFRNLPFEELDHYHCWSHVRDTVRLGNLVEIVDVAGNRAKVIKQRDPYADRQRGDVYKIC